MSEPPRTAPSASAAGAPRKSRPDLRVAAVIVGVMLLANGGYAAYLLPIALDHILPAPMPWIFTNDASPEADAGATFIDVAEAAGISFRRYEWRDGDLPYPAVVGGGVAAADVDDDGWIDLYFTPGGPGLPAALYRNLGGWKFQDVAEAAGLRVDGFGTGAAFADFDNDGDADLYAIVDDGGRLYRNEGTLRFADVTDAAGVSLAGLCGERPCQGSSVTWLDFDRDADLDLYVVNNLDWRTPGLGASGNDYASLIYFAGQQLSVLYENRGDGSFVEVTPDARVENTGKGLGVATGDVDGDGWTDVATANDITENALYLNQQNGRFRNVARAAGVNELKTSMGIVFADLDENGRPDIVTTNFRGDKMSLYLQDEDGSFAYATDSRGLVGSWRGTGWGVAAFDYDLDGWLDLAHAVGRAVPLDPHLHDLNNLLSPELVDDSEDELFRNLGNATFAEVTYSAGGFAGRTTTRAVLAVDLDNDGDEDVVRVNVQGESVEVLRNDRHGAHRSLQLTLEGKTVNRDALGAKVEVTLPDGRVLHREKSASGGYQTGLSPVLTIGLGAAASAMVVVTWPDGSVEDFGTLDAGLRALAQGGAAGGA